MSRARVLSRAATTLGLVFGVAQAAAAQSPEPPRMELAAGGVVLGPMPLGDGAAELERPDGRPLSLFDVNARFKPGPGLELHLARRLAPRWAVEVSGGWTTTPAEVRVSDDFEDAPTTTVTERLFRFSVQGSALWTAARGANRELFFRAGAGWMRELAGATGLSGDGVIGAAGAGVKYWRGRSTPGRGRRWGVRLEGRAVLRARGVQLGAETVRAAPAAAAHLLFGF